MHGGSAPRPPQPNPCESCEACEAWEACELGRPVRLRPLLLPLRSQRLSRGAQNPLSNWGQLLCMGAPAVHCLHGKQCNPPQPNPSDGTPRGGWGWGAKPPTVHCLHASNATPCEACEARPLRKMGPIQQLGAVALHGGPYRALLARQAMQPPTAKL